VIDGVVAQPAAVANNAARDPPARADQRQRRHVNRRRDYQAPAPRTARPSGRNVSMTIAGALGPFFRFRPKEGLFLPVTFMFSFRQDVAAASRPGGLCARKNLSKRQFAEHCSIMR